MGMTIYFRGMLRFRLDCHYDIKPKLIGISVLSTQTINTAEVSWKNLCSKFPAELGIKMLLSCQGLAAQILDMLVVIWFMGVSEQVMMSFCSVVSRQGNEMYKNPYAKCFREQVFCIFQHPAYSQVESRTVGLAYICDNEKTAPWVYCWQIIQQVRILSMFHLLS